MARIGPRALAAGAALAGALAGAPAAAQDTLFFRAPSGNIHCMIFQGDGDWQGVRCDIAQMDHRSFPRRPADCQEDWGDAFELGRAGPAAPVCHGDTVAMPGAPVLDYGHSIRGGGVACTSERSGMTCTNREGRGFTLARAGQRLF